VQLKFIWIGATRDTLLRELEAGYFSRIEKFSSATLTAVREGRKTDRRQVAQQLEQEAGRVRKSLRKNTHLVCLDEAGRQRSSRQLAHWLGRLQHSGAREIAFVAGGHYGLPASLRDSAGEVLSLGKLTLPHELARVILLEQIYRAFCILNRVPYHRS
jgi:23S rRNA (pseudouridine1915-N3)-methyltransferase